MDRYIGVKEITARPMSRQEYNDLRGWELPADENGADEGYLVEYIDGGQANVIGYKGYVSWSPKDVFDRAYRKTVGMAFGFALEALRKGKKVARAGWNGNKRPPKIEPYHKHIPTRSRLEVNGEYAYLVGSKGSVAVFDACLVERLSGLEKFTEGTGGYFCVSTYSNGNQKNTKLHSILFDCPEGLTVDHINGDKLDNRSVNIRFVTAQQNNINRNGTSGKFKGVSFDTSRNKWIASIQVGGKTEHVGRFDAEEEAAIAYDNRAHELHGEYVRLNFPERELKPRMWLCLMPGFVVEEPNERTQAHGVTEAFECGAYIVMWTAQGVWQPGWLASQADMLADDWMVV